jgi:hypothetical protein
MLFEKQMLHNTTQHRQFHVHEALLRSGLMRPLAAPFPIQHPLQLYRNFAWITQQEELYHQQHHILLVSHHHHHTTP